MPDSWLFNENFYPFNELFNEPYLFKAKVKNWWLAESKAFWKSTVTNIPFNFSDLQDICN